MADSVLVAQIGEGNPVSCPFKMPPLGRFVSQAPYRALENGSSANLLRFISGPFGWARVYLKLD